MNGWHALDTEERPPVAIWSRAALDDEVQWAMYGQRRHPGKGGNHKRPITERERKEIIRAYRSGDASLKQLGAEFNRSHTTIRRLLAQAGISTRKRGTRRGLSERSEHAAVA